MLSLCGGQQMLKVRCADQSMRQVAEEGHLSWCLVSPYAN